MNNSWTERQLDELGYVSRGRSRHRPRDDGSLYGGAYPFIQTADVKHSEFYINSHSQTYNEKGLAQSRLWQAGTLCITIAANIADTAILSYDACFPDSIIGFVADPSICDVRFVKYFFDTVQSKYKQIAQGAAQDNLSQQKLLTLKIPTPSVEIQQQIADILSNYDRLIDNNTRRIALLEESIHRLYKEWFVHLRFPGCDRVKIVDGVPEGWRRGSVGDLAKVHSGFAFKSKDWAKHGNPVIKIKNLVGDGSINTTDCDFIDDTIAKNAEKFLLHSGELLIAMTGATVGKVGLMPDLEKNYYLNQRVGRFISAIKEVKYFLYPFFMKEGGQVQVQNLALGSAQPNISSKQIELIELLIPEKKILTIYITSVNNLFQLRQNLINQKQQLCEARDLLLPRLMNGSIAV